MVLKYYLSFLFFSVILCCDILKQTSPSDYMKIKEKIISLNHTKCIYESLKRGNYYQTEKYLSILNENNVQFKKDLRNIVNRKISQVHNIKQKLLDSPQMVLINPSFKWNENKQYVFIQIFFKKNVKDDFLCDELENESFEILTDSNMVHFEGFCYDKKNTLVKFQLDLALNGNLNKLRSQYKNLSKNEKGTYTVTLFKQKTGVWHKLLKNEENNPSNMLKWENFEFAEKSKSNYLSINLFLLFLGLLL